MNYTSIILCFCVILLFSCNKNNSQNPPVPTTDTSLMRGLIAYYPFNGNALDESGNHYNLTVHKAMFANDRFNAASKAYSFNGDSAYMDIPPLAKGDSLSEFTISVWVKENNITNTHILGFAPDSNAYCATSLGFLKENSIFRTYNAVATQLSSTSCTTALLEDTITDPAFKWCHLVLVQHAKYANTTYTYYYYDQYFNGRKLLKPLGTGNNVLPVSFNYGGVIGCYINKIYDFFIGSIDDIRIYNRALTADEVTKLYKEGT